MTDRIALVTGASRGLGYAVATALGTRGWHVIGLARTTGGLEEMADVVEAAGGSTTLVPLDITDDGGLARMCRAIYDRWGRLDLMVHCAAHAEPLMPAGHVAEKELDRAWAVNARATQRLIAMTDPLLRASETGTAVMLTDPDTAGRPFHTIYGMTKAAAEAASRSWQVEGANIGPKVQFFTPQPMPTALRGRFHPAENRDNLTPCADEAERLLAEIDL
ncbi:SDR family NAD(P)-dependent oxidoreductase [Halovulum sp. GXIMD14793]